MGVCLLVLAGCATGTIEPKLGEDESYDGLREVTNARVSQAWIRPGLDLSGYQKILVVNAGVQYRDVREAPTRGRASSRSAFPLPVEARERFEALVSEIFREELQKQERFEIVTEPGPGVLVIVGGLMDVVSNVPPEPIGRGTIYLSQVGEATLVLELRDSETNTTLARILDRRAAEKASGMTWSNTVSNTAEVRRLIRAWATRLRTMLDTVPALTPADD
ncbi:MAG: DUF3313 family protein [Pseudomonadales bacterium]